MSMNVILIMSNVNINNNNTIINNINNNNINNILNIYNNKYNINTKMWLKPMHVQWYLFYSDKWLLFNIQCVLCVSVINTIQMQY